MPRPSIVGIAWVWMVLLPFGNGQDCSSAVSCDECIQRHEDCGWCTALQGQSRTRCQRRDLLVRSGSCLQADIVSPRSAVLSLSPTGQSLVAGRQLVDLTLNKSGDITIDLRSGGSVTFDVTIIRRNDYPVDLYYLLENTAGMSFNLRSLRQNGPKLFDRLALLTPQRRIGLGTFSDKPISPFFEQRRDGSIFQTDAGLKCGATSGDEADRILTECGDPNSYTHIQDLTNDVTAFNTSVVDVQLVQKAKNDNRWGSQLDALMQASQCLHIVGWSQHETGEAIRLIILATQLAYHVAGDGLLAGLLVGNDGVCRTNPATGKYSKATTQDYPSTGQLKAALDRNEILVMFAVARGAKRTDDRAPVYRALTKNWEGRGFVQPLSDDDSEFVELVYNAVKEASMVATLRLAGENRDGLVMTATASCPSGGPVNPGESVERCNNMSTGEEATFTVTLSARDVTKLTEAHRLRLFFTPAYGRINIKLNALTTCACTSLPSTRSSNCSSVGNLTCGQCDCPPENPGRTCRCVEAEVHRNSNRERDCRPHNAMDSEPYCSGNGQCAVNDLCLFACISCRPGFHGKYCQCPDTGCRLAGNGLPCGGLVQGNCQCDEQTCSNCTCRCRGQYTLDDVCNLCEEDSLCRATPTSSVCSGNGDCTCGVCNCTGNWAGSTCSACSSGKECTTGVCSTAAPCINAPPQCQANDNCYLCQGAGRVATTKGGATNCTRYYCPNVTTLPVSPGSTYPFYDALNPPKFTTDGDLCVIVQGNCRRTFYAAGDGRRQLLGLAVVALNEAEDCPSTFKTLPVILGIVLGLVGVVMTLLVIWKIVTYIKDKREYRRFVDSQKSANWERESNPLFKNPTQTFSNPEYQGQL